MLQGPINSQLSSSEFAIKNVPSTNNSTTGQHHMRLKIFGNIFLVPRTKVRGAVPASLISRLIFHVFTALLKNMIIAID